MASVIVLFLVISISMTILGQGTAQNKENNKCRIGQLTAECKSELTEVKDVLQSVPKNVTKLSITLFTRWAGSFPRPSNKVDITPISHLVNLESFELSADKTIGYQINLVYYNYTFAKLRNLKNLVINIPLNKDGLSDIVNHNQLLEKLDLTDTHHLGLRELSVLMSEINTTSLRVLKISNFQTIGTQGHNTVINITALFGSQIAPKMTVLDMSNNDIGFLTPSYVKTLPNLRYLDVSYNILIANLNDIFMLETGLHPLLEVLNMTNQGDFRKKNDGTGEQSNTLTQHTNSGNWTEAAIFCMNTNDYGNISLVFYNKRVFCQIVVCFLTTALGESMQALKEIPCSALGNLSDIIDVSCIFGFKLPMFRSFKVVLWNNLHFNLRSAYKLHGNLCFTPTPVQQIGFSDNKQWMKSFRFSNTINNIKISGLNSIDYI